MTDNHFLKTYMGLQIAALSWNSLSMLRQGPVAFEAPFGPKYASEWGWVCAHSFSAILVLGLGPWLLWRLPGHRLWDGFIWSQHWERP
jgi:hypothetical protein